MKRISAVVVFVLASAGLVVARPPADLPLVSPRQKYSGMTELMVDMMPNYRTFWVSFRNRDAVTSKVALGNLAAQAGAMRRFVVDGDPDHRRLTDEFTKQLGSLVREFDKMPRTRQAESVLELYRTCQGCHEAHAPAEGRKKREYLPQL